MSKRDPFGRTLSKFKHDLYMTDCGLWFHHMPDQVLLTDKAFKELEDAGYSGHMDFKEGVDYIEVNQPKTVNSIDSNEDEACRCGSTAWLYDSEGDAVLCKECWE